MISTYLKAGVAIVLCTVAAYSFGVHRASSGARSELEQRAGEPRAASTKSETARPDARGMPDAGPDVAAIGAALLRAAIANGQVPATSTSASAGSPVEHAREALELRMANAPDNPRETARMEAALRAIINPSLLAGASAEVLCGSTICRIDVSHDDDRGAQKASDALATQVPKMFGATAVYPRGTGERTVYVAKDGAELIPEPLPSAAPPLPATNAAPVASDTAESKPASLMK